jgi:uncharacterized membrane protein YphA (DoxX/SURF4 family)
MSSKQIGVVITVGASALAAIALVLGLAERAVAVGVAVIGIVIGTGVARGNFTASGPR